MVYRVVPDRAAGKDILQDVFLWLWQGLGALNAIDSYRACLNRMALNATLSMPSSVTHRHSVGYHSSRRYQLHQVDSVGQRGGRHP